MKIVDSTARLMGMSDKVWECHANPWSFWTRVPLLFFIVAAVWSRVWLGWYALIPVGIVFIWTWYNPRVFSKPKSTSSWPSKGVLGERVYINRKTMGVEIARHHLSAAKITSLISALGVLVMIIGLVQLDFWMTMCGTLVSFLGKLWFIDRMVWLFEDVKGQQSKIASWEY